MARMARASRKPFPTETALLPFLAIQVLHSVFFPEWRHLRAWDLWIAATSEQVYGGFSTPLARFGEALAWAGAAAVAQDIVGRCSVRAEVRIEAGIQVDASPWELAQLQAMSTGIVRKDQLNPVAALYAKYRAEKSQNIAVLKNEHFGAIGDRVSVKLRVEMVKELEPSTQYNVAYASRNTRNNLRTLLRFVDDAGRVFVWFASHAANDVFAQHGADGLKPVKPGSTYNVVGTVLKQDEFRGQKSTMLSRCVLTAFAE